MARSITIAAAVALVLALSAAPAGAHSVPEVDDEVLVFTGDAYDNEMGVRARPRADGIIAVLIG